MCRFRCLASFGGAVTRVLQRQRAGDHKYFLQAMVLPTGQQQSRNFWIKREFSQLLSQRRKLPCFTDRAQLRKQWRERMGRTSRAKSGGSAAEMRAARQVTRSSDGRGRMRIGAWQRESTPATCRLQNRKQKSKLFQKGIAQAARNPVTREGIRAAA